MITKEAHNSTELDFVIDEIRALTDNLRFDDALRIVETLPEPEKTEQQGIILRKRALN
jgi:hypothetical protein